MSIKIQAPRPQNGDTPEMIAWRDLITRIAQATVGSGTTAQRPVDFMFPGRPYLDTSLGANGKEIHVNKTGTGWVDGDGNTV